MDEFEKQSYESFTIAGNFEKNMLDDETIVSQTAVAIDKDGTDSSDIILTQASLSNDGAYKVLILVKDGEEALSPYKITLKAVTSIGHRWELDIKMKVKEI